MKKLLIIAVVSSFIFTSCSKEAPTQPAQPKTQSTTQNAPVMGADVKAGPPATLLAQQYLITNIEQNWGFAPYVLRFKNASGQFQTVTLNMGQSITICLLDENDFTTNFAYSIVSVGNC